MKFVVLGGYGIIGKIVVADLVKYAKEAEIIIAGRDIEKGRAFAESFKNKRVKAEKVDIRDAGNVARILKGADVAVNCLQYYFNTDIMKSCLKAKVNYVDLGGMYHMTLEQVKLSRDFHNIGKIAVIGMGASPGMSNVLAEYGGRFLKKVRDLEITFAGWDATVYNQKFVLPYSFRTLVDEYTMKAAVFRNGKMKFVEAQTEPKKYDFGEDYGAQTTRLSLHSELATLPQYFNKKGIRNCEFRLTFSDDFNEIMRVLIANGFTSRNMLNFSGKNISTLDITASLMDKFIVKENTKVIDKEIIKIIFNNGKLIMDMITHSDGKTSGGVLDTGIPCSICAIMIARKEVKMSGVCAPESCINPEIIFKELRKRGIAIHKNGITIN